MVKLGLGGETVMPPCICRMNLSHRCTECYILCYVLSWFYVLLCCDYSVTGKAAAQPMKAYHNHDFLGWLSEQA